MKEQRIIRFPEVERRTGMSKSSLYRAIRRGEFPASVKLSPSPNSRAAGWLEEAVEAWIASRAASARRAAA